MTTVAAAMALDPAMLDDAGRGPARVARARQLAIYLAHVSFGIAASATARLFRRDRATVKHACERVEDLREDPAFDRAVERLARAVGQRFAAADSRCVR